MQNKIINQLYKLNNIELYSKEYYRNIDWIDIKEFKALVNKFLEDKDTIKEENKFYNLELLTILIIGILTILFLIFL